MKKEKFLWDIFGSLLLIFYASFLLMTPLFSLSGLSVYVSIFFCIYGAIHLLLSIKFWKQKEFSNLFLGLLSVLFFWILYFGNFTDTTKSFSLFLVAFALFTSLIKLKKADYFHDRKSMIWRIEISLLLLSLLSTILVALNLHNSEEVVLVVFGFYTFLTGIFEFFEVLILNLLKGTLK